MGRYHEIGVSIPVTLDPTKEPTPAPPTNWRDPAVGLYAVELPVDDPLVARIGASLSGLPHAVGVTQLDPYLEGPTVLAYSVDSEVEPARVLAEFAKENEKPLLKAGLIGDRLYVADEVKQLASLPPRDVLLAQVLGTIVAPLSQFAGAVEALLASPARLAGALEEKQGK